MSVRQRLFITTVVWINSLAPLAMGQNERVMPSLQPEAIQARAAAVEKLREARGRFVWDEAGDSKEDLKLGLRLLTGLWFRTDYIEATPTCPEIVPEAVDDELLKATLPLFPELQSLRLKQLINVTDDSLNALQYLKSLRWLFIWSTNPARFPSRITDKGLMTISRTAGQLETLNLIGLPITDEGVRHLSKLSNLDGLTIINCHITAESLVPISRLSRLEYLVLGQSSGYFPTEDTHCDLSMPVTREIHESIARLDGSLTHLTLHGEIHPSLLLSFAQVESLRRVRLGEAETSPRAVAEFLRRLPPLDFLELERNLRNEEVEKELLSKPPKSLRMNHNLFPRLLREQLEEGTP